MDPLIIAIAYLQKNIDLKTTHQHYINWNLNRRYRKRLLIKFVPEIAVGPA